jgi:antitoxin component YwqK of YwqJK toxin-antitoxin module
MTVLELLSLTDKQKQKGVFISGDKTQGEYKEWHDNGQLRVHCFYKNGNIQYIECDKERDQCRNG